MKKNIADIATDEVKKRVGGVAQELSSRYKKTKPYRKDPLDNAEVYYAFKQLNPNNMNDQVFIQQMIQTYGEDAVNDFFFDMHKFETDGRR